MSTLDRSLRKKLADTIITARQVAEEAAADAIRRLGVIEDEAPFYLAPEQKALRVRLRAHARTLGDQWNGDKKKLLTTKQLEKEAAYEIWHRVLFGRFLVERGLLIHPDLGVSIAASELADLAHEAGEPDPWSLVERFAAPSLPAVFKPDDPVLAMTLDPALAKRLRDFVATLPQEIFTADDSLGWTYQSWRTAEKEAVNEAGAKVGAAELPAVTQLFTESYMVKFLLHNTLGAWWAGKLLKSNPALAWSAKNEQELREACALPEVEWTYLRFVQGSEGEPWRIAAGNFPGWPSRAAEITYCDPCCGSGHFLVEALSILTAMRKQEEKVSSECAINLVLRDNLHGLEIDGRCVQIAAFNVALAAWTILGKAVPLASVNIAWVGAPPPLPKSEMGTLGEEDDILNRALEQLHDQFQDAPLLGSLLQVGARDLLDGELWTHGKFALTRLRAIEPEQAEGQIAARGLLAATDLLSRRYVLLATNVPFLGAAKQAVRLATHIASNFPEAKADLSTAMLERMLQMATDGGTVASVTPQNWLLLGSYRDMRRKLLASRQATVVVDLGPAAFREMNWWAARTALVAITNTAPGKDHSYAAFDADTGRNFEARPAVLNSSLPVYIDQSRQADGDARIVVKPVGSGPLLNEYAISPNGMHGGDAPRYRQYFWEQYGTLRNWVLFQGTVDGTTDFGGREQIFQWKENGRHHQQNPNAYVKGMAAWARDGVVVSMMRVLPVTRYTGEKFDISCTPIVPHDPGNLPALWAYCSSPDFYEAVRRIDTKVNVTNATLSKVPFDLSYWSEIAERTYPKGLPEPYTDDPTQWLFHGHPAFSVAGTELHVALARLAGYRWPAESGVQMRLADLAQERAAFACKFLSTGNDGLLPLHGGGGERTLADKMRALLSVAYGEELTLSREVELVHKADLRFDKRKSRDSSLESWLKERAFRQHCNLHYQRPYVWHLWDGLQDGFSIFIHYHRLDHALLEKLTFTLLGDWIAKARAEGRTAHEDRALQLQQQLRAILDGEKPYDIFVRWKAISEQPIGWHPDLGDGVRLIIRPFVEAQILRDAPRINWNKDRGTDQPSAPWYRLGAFLGGNEGDRINDHHLTLAEKVVARELAA